METVDPWRFLFAFLFVIGLIGALAMAAKRYGGRKFFIPAGGERLAVVEQCWLDGKRRLALVRRDGTEHLLLLGDGREMLIESLPKEISGNHEQKEAGLHAA